MSGEEESVVHDFRKGEDDELPRMDVFEKMKRDPEYAMTVADYIWRNHPDTFLEWLREKLKVEVSGDVEDPETEVDWA